MGCSSVDHLLELQGLLLLYVQLLSELLLLKLMLIK